MTLHDDIRREHSLALRDSLLGSSFSWLTLTVLLLVALTFRATPETRVFEIPVYEPPPRSDDTYVPEVPNAGGGLVDVPVSDDFVPLAVPDELEQTQAAEPISSLVDLPFAGTGTGEADKAVPGPGTGAGGMDVIPPSTEYIHREVEPHPIAKVTPEYPGIALSNGIEGKVTVLAYVGTDGRVLRTEVRSKATLFDDAARAAVSAWRFEPARSNGHPVAVWVSVPIVFRLD